MQYDGKRHTTYTGKIVYQRPHKGFTGKDAIRVLLAVSKNYTGSYANWRAIWKISEREMLALLDDYGRGPRDPRGMGEQFERFLQVFDEFVRWYRFFGTMIPGVDWFVDLVADIYEWVRREFPVTGGYSNEDNQHNSDSSPADSGVDQEDNRDNQQDTDQKSIGKDQSGEGES